MEEVGAVLLKRGPRDGDVLPAMALEDSISLPTGSGVVRYVRTGAYQQLRGLKMSEPYRRFWIYEYVDSP